MCFLAFGSLGGIIVVLDERIMENFKAVCPYCTSVKFWSQLGKHIVVCDPTQES